MLPGTARGRGAARRAAVSSREAAERGAVGQGQEVVLHRRAGAAGEGAVERPPRPRRPPTLTPAERHTLHLCRSFEGSLLAAPIVKQAATRTFRRNAGTARGWPRKVLPRSNARRLLSRRRAAPVPPSGPPAGRPRPAQLPPPPGRSRGRRCPAAPPPLEPPRRRRTTT